MTRPKGASDDDPPLQRSSGVDKDLARAAMIQRVLSNAA
jgi:hypothetical protein